TGRTVPAQQAEQPMGKRSPCRANAVVRSFPVSPFHQATGWNLPDPGSPKRATPKRLSCPAVSHKELLISQKSMRCAGILRQGRSKRLLVPSAPNSKSLGNSSSGHTRGHGPLRMSGRMGSHKRMPTAVRNYEVQVPKSLPLDLDPYWLRGLQLDP